MKPKQRPDVVIEGEGFLLRPWKLEDARWYVESRDEEVFRWTEERRDLTIPEAQDSIRRANAGTGAIGFAVVDSKSLELLGNVTLAFREDNRKNAEIMYWLASRGRGRGIATESVKLLCRWAFDTLGLERVMLKTHVGNIRSQAVAERAGFRSRVVEDACGGQASLWYELTNRT
jgi:RimJ/RimL family protein N-acetyltransferase